MLLETLPDEELRNGLAEVVKTGLLAGEPLWELDRDEQVRRCAAFKAAVCLADPLDRGARTQLNLGHTFAHALEAASGYRVPHGRAVALGLLAALRLSGLEDESRTVEALLSPEPVEVDRERAWTALGRDKKASGRPDRARPARRARTAARHGGDRARASARGSRLAHRVGSAPCRSPS